MANVTWQCDKCGKQHTVYKVSSYAGPGQSNCSKGGYHVWSILHDGRILETMQKAKIHEYQLEEQHLAQAEIASIKDKVYNLALNKSFDTENISRLIKLLLRQHDSHTELIYKNVMSLGSPFDTSIKEILCNQLKENINDTYQNANLSFHQKACKYFMPYFSGYEYDIFTEFLKNRSDFLSAVNDEIKLQKIKVEQLKNEKLKEIAELNQTISNYNNTIRNDTSNYKLKNKTIALVKTIFGKYTSDFPPRLIWYMIIGYIGSLYFFHIKFSLYPLLILLALGFILSYIIIKVNGKSENKNSKLKQIISDNEYTLRDYINKLEKKKNELQENEDNNADLINNLNEYLQNK